MKTIYEHIQTLKEPYRSEAMRYLNSFPYKKKMKFRTLENALVWTLPAGMLKYSAFWSKIKFAKSKVLYV